MNEDKAILLSALDCSEFTNQEGHQGAIEYFIKNSNQWDIFHFNQGRVDDSLEIARFNYSDAKWYAGRMVGEACFNFNGTYYKIEILPRFGLLHLFRMLESIYNVKFTHSEAQLNSSQSLNILIKKLISFLWLQLLSNANKHGLPRHNISRTHKGSSIRGRMNIRRSILPLYTEKVLVSEYREKALDEVVAQLLKQAYEKLIRQYGLGEFNPPPNSKDVLIHITSAKLYNRHVPISEYTRIRYKSIFRAFKPVVDLSWDILHHDDAAQSHSDQEANSFSFFIDMGEVWEMYLLSLIKTRFSSDGWSVESKIVPAYEGKSFKRTLIPDIIMKRDNNVLVFDAKYKAMQYRYFDYDRVDFFQIHTYLAYFQKRKKVIAGGLLFPLGELHDDQTQSLNTDECLLSNNDGSPITFIVDGIDLSELKNHNSDVDKLGYIFEKECDFLMRIQKLIVNNEKP